MSATHAAALDAIAFQLAAALDAYELDVARLVESRLDIELYRGVSEQVDRIRMYSSALPQAGVQWVELLIAHAELVHCLWRTHHATDVPAREAPADVLARHSHAVAGLRRRCMALLGGDKPR